MSRNLFLLFILSGLLATSCAGNEPELRKPDEEIETPGGEDDNEENGLNVICLGNSITRHEYAPDAGWYSDWGMAASKEENDYCHQLEEILSRKYPGSKVTPLDITSWECNLSLDLSKMLDRHCDGRDAIVIRLGENIQDMNGFKAGIRKLVQYGKSKVKHVFITGCYWKNDEKERAIMDVAKGCGISYISLEEINSSDTRPAPGDYLYDVDGNPYAITQNFICSHPNDLGMKRIAERIGEELLFRIAEEETSPGYEAHSFILDNPQTFVFLPASRIATGRAVVACPGGGYGYCMPEDNYEGNGWASFFNDRGIALIVVKYTLPKGNCQLPIADAETTVRRVREHAEEWHINTDDVGIMGFSAGGHLASTIATHSTGDVHPDFQILFYPVITMGANTHAGSRDNFLGKNPSQEQIELYSNEKQVKADTPRAFITFTEDDSAVPPVANGMAYYQALTDKKIPVTLVSWQSSNGWPAGHGWGNMSNFVHHEELLARLSDWLESF